MKGINIKIIDSIHLDLSREQFNSAITVKQYDNLTRGLNIFLYDKGTECIVEDFVNVRYIIQKPSGCHVIKDIPQENIIENKIKLILADNDINECGISKCELVLSKDDKILSTFYFKIRVAQSGYKKDNIESSSEYQSFHKSLLKTDEALKQVKDLTSITQEAITSTNEVKVYAAKQGEYAKKQGDFAKDVLEEINKVDLNQIKGLVENVSKVEEDNLKIQESVDSIIEQMDSLILPPYDDSLIIEQISNLKMENDQNKLDIMEIKNSISNIRSETGVITIGNANEGFTITNKNNAVYFRNGDLVTVIGNLDIKPKNLNNSLSYQLTLNGFPYYFSNKNPKMPRYVSAQLTWNAGTPYNHEPQGRFYRPLIADYSSLGIGVRYLMNSENMLPVVADFLYNTNITYDFSMRIHLTYLANE